MVSLYLFWITSEFQASQFHESEQGLAVKKKIEAYDKYFYSEYRFQKNRQ